MDESILSKNPRKGALPIAQSNRLASCLTNRTHTDGYYIMKGVE